MKVSNYHWSIGFLLLGSLLIFPVSASSEEPTSPFGQSNSFAFNTNRIGFGETAIMQISSVPESGVVPSATTLDNLMPNPFNPSITISFNVGQAGNFDLNIYDLGGHLIKTLATQEFEVGQYNRRWDGRDHNGSMMPAGVYLVRIQGETATDSKKITLVK